MEVVCLILDPMLASRPCSHAFWVLTSLHLLTFITPFGRFCFNRLPFRIMSAPECFQQQMSALLE